MHTYLTLTYARAHKELYALAHWGRVTHISFGNITYNQHITSVGSDNGLSRSPRQAIIWNNAVLLLIGPIGTRFGRTMFEIHFHSRVYLGKCRLGNDGHFVSASRCCIHMYPNDIIKTNHFNKNIVNATHSGSRLLSMICHICSILNKNPCTQRGRHRVAQGLLFKHKSPACVQGFSSNLEHQIAYNIYSIWSNI